MSLLKKNAIVATGVILSNGLAFVFHFVAGRMLGPDEYGEFAAMLTVLMVIALPLTSLNSTVTKFVSKANVDNPATIRKLKHRFQRDMLLTIGPLVLVLIFLRNPISEYLNLADPKHMILIGIAGLVSLFLSINRGVAIGVQNYKRFSSNLVLEAVARLLILIALAYLGTGAIGAIIAFGAAYFLAFGILEFAQKRSFTETERTNFGRKELYRFMGVMLAVQFAIQGSINLPTLYIKHAYTSEFTGYWNAALTISRSILFVTMAVSMVLFTETAGSDDSESRKRNLRLSVLLVLLGSGIIALLFYIFPELFLRLLFGAEFVEAADILQWMGFAMIGFSLLDLWSKYYLAKMK